MALNILLLLMGIALAWQTLRDVFDTVVVPGGSRASLRVTRRVGSLLLALWKRVRGRRGLSGSFAPLVLVSSFLIWMSLLAVGFGLMTYAGRHYFDPPIASFADSVYEAGSALLTIGLSPHFPVGPGRWIVVAAGFCGLAVMTMAVTYLLDVQSSISRRDIEVIKLNTSAGNPPSAISLLQRYAKIRHCEALIALLDEGRDWCATVRQSHTVHPSLMYFLSTSTGAGWPAALGAMLDLALFAEHLIDDDRLYGPAVLMNEEGRRMAKEFALIMATPASDAKTDENALRTIAARLSEEGYALRADPDFHQMALERAEYAGHVEALARHLGKPPAPLLPSRGAV